MTVNEQHLEFIHKTTWQPDQFPDFVFKKWSLSLALPSGVELQPFVLAAASELSSIQEAGVNVGGSGFPLWEGQGRMLLVEPWGQVAL